MDLVRNEPNSWITNDGRLCLFSDAILRIIGRQGAAILVRVMGIILCSLAVEIVLTTLGVASWAPVPR
jgi:small neutral amino acid transporter SnatA (MarC family)